MQQKNHSLKVESYLYIVPYLFEIAPLKAKCLHEVFITDDKMNKLCRI